jgi:hypothetical protein
LIGTCKIQGRWNTLNSLSLFFRKKKDLYLLVLITGWCQRQNGSWKNMLQKNLTPPVVNLLSHVDSLEQLQIDKKLITNIAKITIDAKI